jgi:hypothetical protein
MQLCENFFDLCLKYWNSIYHSRVFSLDILSAPRQRGRTLKGDMLSLLLKNEYSFYKTQWVDMNFIFNIRSFEEIDFEITNCRSGARTSGVGLWLTNKFKEYEMYQTTHSLLLHGDHYSMMHSDLRNKTPIITKE